MRLRYNNSSWFGKCELCFHVSTKQRSYDQNSCFLIRSATIAKKFCRIFYVLDLLTVALSPGICFRQSIHGTVQKFIWTQSLISFEIFGPSV